MTLSMFHHAATARRRMTVLRTALDAAPANAPACRVPPVYVRLRGRLQGKPLWAIVLAVLAAHVLLTLELWHAFAPGLPIAKLRPLDVEVDLRDLIRPSAPSVPHPPAPNLRNAQPAPYTARPHNAPAPRLRGARESVPPRQTATPTHDTMPEATRAGAPEASASSASTQAPNDHVSGNPVAVPDMPPAPARDAQPATQPVTEPDFGAAYLHNPAPAYPASAQRRGLQGTVLLRVHVLADGRPDQVLIASPSGQQSLDDAAVEAVTGWRFVPAKRGAQAIDGWVKVPIDFKLGT